MNQSISYVLCLMSYVLRLMSYVVCLMSYVLCLMSYMLYRLKKKLGESPTRKGGPAGDAGRVSREAEQAVEAREAGTEPSVLQQWFPLYGGWYAPDDQDSSLPKVRDIVIEG